MSHVSRRQFLSLSGAATALLLCPQLSYADVVHKMRGKIMINGKIIDTHAQVKSGDLIETADKSELIFKLHKDAYKIKANSKVKIHSAKADGAGLLEVLGGAMLAVFGKSNKRIQTPVATIGIRGTGVFIAVNEQRSHFCTCFGETDIEAGNNKMQIKATHHQAKHIGQDRHIVDADMFGHHDHELQELATIAGQALPASFTA